MPSPNDAIAGFSPIEGVIEINEIGQHFVRLPDGQRIDLQRQVSQSGKKAYLGKCIVQTERMSFQICPVCNFSIPDTREHVPPSSIGGSWLTMTCEPCNSGFGKFEDELKSHVNGSSSRSRFSADAIRGFRGASTTYVPQPDGSFALLVETAAPGITEMLRSGEFAITFEDLKPELWKTAVLKHAYLAACLILREIPATPCALLVREELSRARGNHRNYEIGPAAEQVGKTRLLSNTSVDVGLYAVEIDGVWCQFIGLGEYGLVRWPLDDVAPPS